MRPTANLILLLLLSVNLLFAGNRESNQITFKSATLETIENLNEFVEDPGIQPEELVQDRYYRLIQFDVLPTNEEKQVLSAAGIDLLSYVPSRSFISSIHKDASLNILTELQVRGVYRHQPAFKVHPKLLRNELPNWILRGGDLVSLSVNYHQDIPAEEVIEAISGLVDQVEFVSEYGEYITVVADINQVGAISNLPHLVFVEPGPAEGEPEDFNGRSMHRSNVLDADYGAGRQYDGTGVGVAVNDDGYVGPHVDFKGRIVHDPGVNFDVSGFNTHGDGVAGIIGGAGNIDPTYAGMAVGSDLRIRDYVNTLPNTVNLHNNDGIMIFNSSYSNGCNAGYTSTTRQVDQEIRQNPALIQVFSAGNSGNSDCGYVNSGASWGNITGGHKIGKNVIATANLFYDEVLVQSSSRGPAEDGRLKPDIAAHGQGQGSTDEENQYMGFGGTSAASPGIAGICAQMYDAYRSLNNGNDPESALIKALLLNSADDMGNPGPDFSFGWGRVNAGRAVTLLENGQFITNTVSNGSTNTHSITVPANTKELKVMLYWSDYEATTSASKDLVNDLDLELVRPNNNVVLPWILDPSPNVAAITSNATRGVDDLNNAEQVTIDNPAAGSYTLRVIGNTIPQGPQKYYLIYEYIDDAVTVTYPQGGESFRPGETVAIRWDAADRNGGSFQLQYSSNNGSTWTTFANNLNDTARTYDWTIPSNTPVNATSRIRVRRGAIDGTSQEPFNIMGVPGNLNITKICPTYTELSWSAVNNADGYDVYLLGQKYMDSVGSTTATSFQIPGTNPTIEDWVTVRAWNSNGATSRRAIAIKKNPGINNCSVQTDAEMTSISSPVTNYSSCFNTSNLPVTILITNTGLTSVSNFDVKYQVDNNAVISETFSGTIAVSSNSGYSFNTDVSFPGTGTYELKIWTEIPGDQNPWNDTIKQVVEVFNSTLVSLPYSEDFETFNNCSTASDCEAGTCSLTAGWRNLPNGQEDDIDWRTNNGSTNSNNTGPSIDAFPGTSLGKYLYTEASFGQTGCTNKEAMALTPCLDLTNTVNPILNFQYHMFGQSMGDLHIDVFDGSNWSNDIITPISGDQGDQWVTASANLSAFNGSQIVIRFRGETGGSFTSDIAIDDINVIDNAPPVANFSVSKTDICTNEPFTVVDSSIGSGLTYSWNFGSGASPASSGSTGPHTVSYTFPGSKSITLQLTNQAGTDFHTETITVTGQPASFFNVNKNNNEVTLSNSSSGATNYSWDFGDGTNSTQQDPVKTYTATGIYTITLIATNGCGSDTSTRTVNIDKITSVEIPTLSEVKLYPNPADGQTRIDFGQMISEDITIRLIDASGRTVFEKLVNDVDSLDIDLNGLAAGVYQVELISKGKSASIPLQKK